MLNQRMTSWPGFSHWLLEQQSGRPGGLFGVSHKEIWDNSSLLGSERNRQVKKDSRFIKKNRTKTKKETGKNTHRWVLGLDAKWKIKPYTQTLSLQCHYSPPKKLRYRAVPQFMELRFPPLISYSKGKKPRDCSLDLPLGSQVNEFHQD